MLRTLFPFLVLRGSKSRPDVPLLDALREYEATKEERDRLSAQLEEAEQKLKILEETALDIREAKRPLPETEDEEEEARIRQRIIEGDPTIPAEMRRYIQKLQHKVQVYEQTRSEATESWVSAHLVLNRTMKQFIAGGIAGAVARTAVAPIDRVKILMQTQHITYQGETRYHNILGTMRTVWKDEGLHRLWRGNVTNVVRVVPYAATQFTSYDYFKQHILRWSTARNSDSGEGPVLELTTPQRLFAGACAGMTATTITHPLDVVRLRLNVQPELRGAWDAMRSIAQEGLLRGMFKGYVPTVISLSPFIAINFATFDQLQTMSFRLAASASGVQPETLHPAVTLLLGAIAGIFAQTCCFPLDTVRRRMQMKGRVYASTLDAFRTIFRDEGMRGFYRGMAPNAVKVVPNNAIRFLVFTQIKEWWGITRTSKDE